MSAYQDALTALAKEVDALHELMHDPFKAPELTVYALPDVQAAMWNVQVEFAAMSRAAGGQR